MNLTDVVFGEAAINYEEGKWVAIPEKDGKSQDPLFRPDYNRVSASAGDLQAFADSDSRPTYHYGEYVSGSAVRTDAGAIFEKTRGGMQRNAIALDMEASAFIQLCGHFGEYAKCLGVVKGISDFGNSNKGKVPNAKAVALKNTANALREWIVYRIPEISWQIDESQQ
jgi:nucleoside phosphorylase